MSVLTDEARAALHAQIVALDDAEKAIRTAQKPFDDAVSAIETARELILEPYEGEYRTCECCSKLILGGDPCYSDGGDDGLVFCPECAPTYGDWKDEVDSRIAAAQGDEEEIALDGDAVKTIAAHIEGGGSLADKLPVGPL